MPLHTKCICIYIYVHITDAAVRNTPTMSRLDITGPV